MVFDGLAMQRARAVSIRSRHGARRRQLCKFFPHVYARGCDAARRRVSSCILRNVARGHLCACYANFEIICQTLGSEFETCKRADCGVCHCEVYVHFPLCMVSWVCCVGSCRFLCLCTHDVATFIRKPAPRSRNCGRGVRVISRCTVYTVRHWDAPHIPVAICWDVRSSRQQRG